MLYRRRPTPLHAARAAVGCLYCLAFVVAALVLSSPLTLAALGVAIAGAGIAAGVGREFGRAARFALPMALLICVINALVSRDGSTVIWRFGHVPLYGEANVTLEATVYGAVLGLRALALVGAATLYSTTVDPDEVLRLLRRFSFRSALTATLATRLVPVLSRDARRVADAQRCRPGRPPTRFQLMRATTSGVLDRALDVAAALEVRAYSSACRYVPGRRVPWSRHDYAFAASAAAIIALVIVSRVVGLAPFTAYPSLEMPLGPAVPVVCVALPALAWLPFADRRGVAR
jgi:energy-coupling factor transport system permease protein